MKLRCFFKKHKNIIIEKFEIKYSFNLKFKVTGIKNKCDRCGKCNYSIYYGDVEICDDVLYNCYMTHDGIIFDNLVRRNYNISSILK